MKTVTSKDGTKIAYDQVGKGPAVILVTGALGTRSDMTTNPLVKGLEWHFTVMDYDRRGRGDSGDTAPYTVEREIEDIEALIDAAGGSAYVYGPSSGAILALEAARALPTKIKKLALYEPPFIIDDSRPPLPTDYVEQLNAAIAAGRPGDAVEIFMTKAMLIPAEFVTMMRNAPPGQTFGSEEGAQPPTWSDMEKVAHTLAYDGMIVRDYLAGKPLPPGRWANVPARTLVIVGGNSEPFFHDGAQALVDAMPHAQRRVLEGQDHAVNLAVLAPVVDEFFRVNALNRHPTGRLRTDAKSAERIQNKFLASFASWRLTNLCDSNMEEHHMKKVTSKDGTTIAYDQTGSGPALILVGGMFEQRAFESDTAFLAVFPDLTQHFSVYHYDRRGRGDSGDTLPYAVQREIEDIEAVIDIAGGSAYLSGISSGASLALEAALALGGKVKKLVLYDPPYNDDPDARQSWAQFRKKLQTILAEGRHGDAVELFMLQTGMPREHLQGIRQIPMWPMLEAVAPTIAYDAAAVGEEAAVPAERAATLPIPALVMNGSESYPFMLQAGKTLAKAIPHAQYRVLEGQTHEVKPEAIAPALIEFFEG
jgi:pimeloyl-ACP methyl ester carboxylesterase